MRHYVLYMVALALFAVTSGAWGQSISRTPLKTAKLITGGTLAEETRTWHDVEVGTWQKRVVAGESCFVSPVIDFGWSSEVNHHSIRVDYTGSGKVEVSLGHSSSAKFAKVLEKKYLRFKFKKISSGAVQKFTSLYKAERYIWLMLRTQGEVSIKSIEYRCLLGKGTLYGHVGKMFLYRGGTLKYRLMYPRNYDPARSYPLVVSGHGSGGIGNRNIKNMEMVTLARYLGTRFYDSSEFECFSLVPQVPMQDTIPAPYWPKGTIGAGDKIYHPYFPSVNEKGWYVQASLALIRSMLKDESLNIDARRVYYAGFSLGGKACWEFLKADPKMFAAAMSGAGWAIGRPYAIPTPRQLPQLRREVGRYKHVPVFIFAGEKDKMRLSSMAVFAEIQSQKGNKKSRFVQYPGASHVSSAGKGWANRKNMEWLFSNTLAKSDAAAR